MEEYGEDRFQHRSVCVGSFAWNIEVYYRSKRVVDLLVTKLPRTSRLITIEGEACGVF
jgi:hypothetical protein